MKRIYNFLFVLLVAFLIQEILPRISEAQAEPEQMYTSVQTVDLRHPGSAVSGEKVPLSMILKKVEKKYDATFIYEYSVVRDKYVSYSKNFLTRNTGKKLAQVLADLNLGYIRLDKETYVLFPKNEKKELLNVIQQVHSVKGTVTDASTGEALPGVNVYIKGTTVGAATDAKGKYKLNVPSLTDTLMFSYIGYKTEIVPINGRTQINAALNSQSVLGKQLVVVGYGTQAKRDVTSSISTVSSKELQSSTETSNTVNMFAGKLAGLRVIESSGEPGSYSSSIDIRGFGSPLIVVDGVPGGDINRINPNDIQSISVIKDASAAVYGVRAANGVILVTTKQGSKGKVQMKYESTFGWTRPTIMPKTMNAYQYASLYDGALVNNGEAPAYSSKQLQEYNDGTLSSTNWEQLVMKNYAPHNIQNFSVSGGSKKITYFMSLGYLRELGMWKSNDLTHQRVNFRSNITAQITGNLKAKLELSGHQDNQNLPGFSTHYIERGVWWEYPTITPYANNNPDYLQEVPDGTNPLATTNSSISGYTNNLGREFTGIITLQYQIPSVKGLETEGYYSYRTYYNNNKTWQPEYYLYTYDTATKTYAPYTVDAPTTLSRNFDQSIQTDWHVSLNYDRVFNDKHHIKALLLFDQYQDGYQNFYGSKQFAITAVDYLYAGEAVNQQINSDPQTPTADEGLVGRLNYTYRDKYLVTYSFRYDGSSKFAPSYRWGFFPSVSLGWRISSENFVRSSSSLNFIDNLMLRASYGKVGDDASSSFQFLTGYTYPGNQYVFDNSLVNGLSPLGMPNPEISWYTSKTADIGLDGDLWDGRLNFSFDVFQRRRSGLLAYLNLKLPETVGASLPQENLNSDENRGFEIQLSNESNIGQLHYQITGNMAYTRHKNMFVERATSSNSYLNWRNNNSYRWDDIYWGYTVIGRFQSMQQIKDYPIDQDGKGNTTLLPGDFMYKDTNGDGVISSLDEQPIGLNTQTPEVTFGLYISAQWKHFDFNALFQGGARSEVTYLGTEQLYAPMPYGRSGLAMFMNRWHHENVLDSNSPWVPGYYPANKGIQNNNSTNYWPNTFWLQDASYIRLKSLEIGYTLTPKIVGVQSIRIFINGFNFLTLTKLKNMDPEYSNSSSGYLYPIQKNFNIGLTVNF